MTAAEEVSLRYDQGTPVGMTMLWGTVAVEAAGGVLWRYAADGSVEIALVHRPKYDDWSVPKGKLKRREHLLLGALREVAEETGCDAAIGRPLGEIRYLKDGLPKRVRYWAMCCTGEAAIEFLEGDETAEVDQLHWLSPADALPMLSPGRDAPAVERFMADTRPTWPLVLARHGSAGDRLSWAGDDTLRPLDEIGEEQADVLGAVLGGYGIEAVHSADVARCVDTVMPYAESLGVEIVDEPSMSEYGWSKDEVLGPKRLVAIAESRVPTVVSSQRGALPGLLTGLLTELGGPVPADLSTRKGGFWVLQLTESSTGSGLPELVSLERFEPVPQFR